MLIARAVLSLLYAASRTLAAERSERAGDPAACRTKQRSAPRLASPQPPAKPSERASEQRGHTTQEEEESDAGAPSAAPRIASQGRARSAVGEEKLKSPLDRARAHSSRS